jgi:hypothetical protein
MPNRNISRDRTASYAQFAQNVSQRSQLRDASLSLEIEKFSLSFLCPELSSFSTKNEDILGECINKRQCTGL